MAKPHFWILPFADQQNNGSFCRLNPILSRGGLLLNSRLFAFIYSLKNQELLLFFFTGKQFPKTQSLLCDDLLPYSVAAIITCDACKLFSLLDPPTFPVGCNLFSFLSLSLVLPLSPILVGQKSVNTFVEQFSTNGVGFE